MDRASMRAINRTYLDRQFLLTRSTLPLHAVVEHLVALQAQDVLPPFVSLWSRMSRFEPGMLDAALADRTLVRGTFLRATVHLSTRQDVMHLLPHLLPEYYKMAHGPTSINGLLQKVPAARITEWGAVVLGSGDLGNAELREQAAIEFPGFEPQEIASAVQWLLPVIQTPPRGHWKNNTRPRWALAEWWLGEALNSPRDLESIILRYIRAYGPIAAGDFQTWSRITGARKTIATLRPHLRTIIGDDGRTYLDDPEIEWIDAATPASVRLLGHFDNALLSHKERRRILDDALRQKVMNNGIGRAAILVDGRVAGRYRTLVVKKRAVFRYELFRPLRPEDLRDLRREASALLSFMDPGMEQECIEVASLLG